MLFGADITGIGRCDAASVTDQTRLELLVAGMKNLESFHSAEGEFKEYTKWPGLAIDSNGDVRSIDFAPMMLYLDVFDPHMDEEEMFSYIIRPGGTMDFRWIPTKVKFFSAPSLKLEGTIETEHLPPALGELQVQNNELEGPFRLECLPAQMSDVYISNNLLSGELNLTELPLQMLCLVAGSNFFTGTLDFTNLPDGIKRIDVSQTKVSGAIDVTKVPESLGSVKIGGTRIRQEVLVLPVATHPNLFLDVSRNAFQKIVDEEGNDVPSGQVHFDYL